MHVYNNNQYWFDYQESIQITYITLENKLLPVKQRQNRYPNTRKILKQRWIIDVDTWSYCSLPNLNETFCLNIY